MDNAHLGVHFNSHAHVERDDYISMLNDALENFNSHAHVERDVIDPEIKYEELNFNSHAHVERDEIKERASSKAEISTHTLTWSVTRPPSINMRLSMYFNSHAHVERDLLVVNYQIFTNISTHTLTWSVTGLPTWRFLLLVISTHTLTWSVTERKPLLDLVAFISTHTLTWSVTGIGNGNIAEFRNFNSHAHVERDFPPALSCPTQGRFQLTRSRGA